MHALLKAAWVLCRLNNTFAFVPFWWHTTGIPFQSFCSVQFGCAAQDMESTGSFPRGVIQMLAWAWSQWSTWKGRSLGKDQLMCSQCTRKGQYGRLILWEVYHSQFQFGSCLSVRKTCEYRGRPSEINPTKQTLALHLRAIHHHLAKPYLRKVRC